MDEPGKRYDEAGFRSEELPVMGQMHSLQEDVLSTFTRASLQYRQKAASLGQMACVEKDARKVRSLLDVAVSWIQLAENEELLASEHRASVQIF